MADKGGWGRCGGEGVGAVTHGTSAHIFAQYCYLVPEDPEETGLLLHLIANYVREAAGRADEDDLGAMVVRYLPTVCARLLRTVLRVDQEGRMAGSAEVSDLSGEFDEVDSY